MSDDITLVDAIQTAAIRWMVESHTFWALSSLYLKPDMFTGPRKILFQVAKLEHKRHRAIVEQDVQFLFDSGKIPLETTVQCHTELYDIWHGNHPDEEATWAAVGRSLRQPLRSALVDEMILQVGQRGDLRKFIAQINAIEDLGTFKEKNHIDISAGGDALRTLLRQKANTRRRGVGNPHLDSLMKGGPPVGTLTVFSAKTGIGKSLVLGQTLAYNAVCGYEGCMVSLELDQGDQASRIIAPIIGMTIDQVLDPANESLVVELVESLNLPPMHIVYMDEGASVDEIRTEVRENYSKTADVVCIDYLDLIGGGLTFVQKDNDYKLGGRVAKDLRKWAKQDGLQVYSASQPQRQSSKKAEGPLGTEDMADSQHKSRVSDQVITLNLETGPDGEELVYGYTAKFRTGIPRKRTPGFPKAAWGAYGCVLPCPAFTRIPLDEKGHPVVPTTALTGTVNKKQPYAVDTDYEFE